MRIVEQLVRGWLPKRFVIRLNSMSTLTDRLTNKTHKHARESSNFLNIRQKRQLCLITTRTSLNHGVHAKIETSHVVYDSANGTFAIVVALVRDGQSKHNRETNQRTSHDVSV